MTIVLPAPVGQTADNAVRLVDAFRRAASIVPAYRQLIREHGVDARAIVDSRRSSPAAHPE